MKRHSKGHCIQYNNITSNTVAKHRIYQVDKEQKLVMKQMFEGEAVKEKEKTVKKVTHNTIKN